MSAERPSNQSRTLTSLGDMVGAVTDSFRRDPAPDAEAAVQELFPTGSARLEFILRFASLIVLSSSIAAFGLLADSEAVVIGAMLVAPLMTPILAVAAATVRAYNRELMIAAAIIVLGTVLAVAVGYVVAVIAGEGFIGGAPLPEQIVARTYPGLLDLGIAVTAGAAGGYILPRRSALSALPGVGIAVALVPPLATSGITLRLGTGEQAWNAMLLFLTNFVAIVFAAGIMLLLAGFHPRQRVSRRHLVLRVCVTLVAVIAVAIPLGAHTRETLVDGQLNRTVASAVEAWDPAASIVEVRASSGGASATVDLRVSGPNSPARAWTLAERIRDEFGKPVDLDLRYEQSRRIRVTAR